MKKVSAVVAGLIFFFSAVSAPLVEASYWNDRRATVQARQSTKTLYAMGPSGAGPLAEALPFLDSSASGSVEVGSLSGAALPSAHSSLSPEQIKMLPVWLQGLSSIHGSISQAYFAPDAAHRPLVVHIQDVHEEREAQLNISGLINEVVRTGAVTLVGLEGAVGSFDLSPYLTFPNKTVIADVADFLVQEHMIGGGEHAGWTAEKTPTLWGIEEMGVYLKNLNSFKDALPIQQRVQDRIKNWEYRLAQMKPKVYSPALKEFDHSQAQYRAGTLPLPEFVALLDKIVRPQSSQYPSMAAFQRCLVLEKSLNFSLVEKERGELVRRLTQALSEKEIAALVQRTLLYRSGRMSHGAYYDSLQSFCETKGVSFSKFPAMAAYVKYVLAADQIKPELLLTELDAMQDHAVATLIRTPEERAIHDLSQGLHSLTNLAQFKMSPHDWAVYEHARPQIMDMAARMDRLAPGSDPYAGDLSKDLMPFEGFCQAALARDKTLVKNLLAKMEQSNQKTAILLAGGFHTGGMTDLLQKNKVSYVVFTPAFTDVSTGSHYLDFLKDRPALEKLFTQEKITTKVPMVTGDNKTPGYSGEAVGEMTEMLVSAVGLAAGIQISPQIEALSPAVPVVEKKGDTTTAEVDVPDGRVGVAVNSGTSPVAPPAGSESVATYVSTRDGGFNFSIYLSRGRGLLSRAGRAIRSFFSSGRTPRGKGQTRAPMTQLQPAGAHPWVVGPLFLIARIVHYRGYKSNEKNDARALDLTIRYYAPIVEALLVWAVFVYLVAPAFGLPALKFTYASLQANILPFFILNMALGLSHKKGFVKEYILIWKKFGNKDPWQQEEDPWQLENLTFRERLNLGLRLFFAHILILGGLGWGVGAVGHVLHNWGAGKGWWPAGALGGTSTSLGAGQQIAVNRILIRLANLGSEESQVQALRVQYSDLDQEIQAEIQRLLLEHETMPMNDGMRRNVLRVFPELNESLRTEWKSQTDSTLSESLNRQIAQGAIDDAARDFLMRASQTEVGGFLGVYDDILPDLTNQEMAQNFYDFLFALRRETIDLHDYLKANRDETTIRRLGSFLNFVHTINPNDESKLNYFSLEWENTKLDALVRSRDTYAAGDLVTQLTEGLQPYNDEWTNRVNDYSWNAIERAQLRVRLDFNLTAIRIAQAIRDNTPIFSEKYFHCTMSWDQFNGYIKRVGDALKLGDEESRKALVAIADEIGRLPSFTNDLYFRLIGRLSAIHQGDPRINRIFQDRLLNFPFIGQENLGDVRRANSNPWGSGPTTTEEVRDLILGKRAPPAQGGINANEREEIVAREFERLLGARGNAPSQRTLFDQIRENFAADAFEIFQGIVKQIPRDQSGDFRSFISLVGDLASKTPGWVVPAPSDVVALALPVKVLSFALEEKKTSSPISQISLTRVLEILMGKGNGSNPLPTTWIHMSPRRMVAWLSYATPDERRAGMNALRTNPDKAKALLGVVLMDAAAAHGNRVSYQTGGQITENGMHQEMEHLGQFALWFGLTLEEAQDEIDETYNGHRTLVDHGRGTPRTNILDTVSLRNPLMGMTEGVSRTVEQTSLPKVKFFVLPLVKDSNDQVTWQSGVDEATQRKTIAEIGQRVDDQTPSAIGAFDSSITAEELKTFFRNQISGNKVVFFGGELAGLHRDDGSVNFPRMAAEMALRMGKVQEDTSDRWYDFINPQVYTNEPAALFLGRYWNVINVLLLLGGEAKPIDLEKANENKVERYIRLQA